MPTGYATDNFPKTYPYRLRKPDNGDISQYNGKLLAVISGIAGTLTKTLVTLDEQWESVPVCNRHYHPQ